MQNKNRYLLGLTLLIASACRSDSSTNTATPTALPIIIRQLLQGAAPISTTNPPQPTLADFWVGKAKFMPDVLDTGLPMGESETIVMSNGELWSYLHASNRSAGVKDQCGAAVEFPGCTVIMRSTDDGKSFQYVITALLVISPLSVISTLPLSLPILICLDCHQSSKR